MDIQAIHRVQLPFPPALRQQVARFYGELLGLTSMPPPAGAVLRYAARGQRVDLVATEAAPPPPAGLTQLSFEVQGLPQLRRRLLAAALQIEEHQALPGYLRFFVHDPAGNRLEFVEPDVD
ncbi:VOC family protein [Pseudorhodoferax sp.]|uniref:VOC family protein n=1 Tax=Pseudorhodoferax sp. TaxID=1993553 RepID=UPI0039E2A811